MNIKIEYEDFVDVTKERDPDNEWSGEDTAHDYTIEGYKVVGEKEYWDFVLDNDPKGKTLYFVYVLYDTGNSFCQEANKMCMVGLYEREDDAEMVINTIAQDYKNQRDSFDPVKVTLPSGKEEILCTSTWKGHFERLNDAIIYPISSTGKRRISFR